MNKLNRIEKEIIRVLLTCRMPLTINQISKRSGISWATVKKYITKLMQQGLLDEIRKK